MTTCIEILVVFINLPNQHIIELTDKWRNGTITEEELQELEEWYQQNQDAQVNIPHSFATSEKQHSERLLKAIRRKAGLDTPVIPIYRNRIFKIAAAAIILLTIGTGYWLMREKKNAAESQQKPIVKTKDVAPGHDGAILTLADGNKIVLDNIHDGKITEIAVKNGNTLSYKNSSPAKVEYNTMTTPKARQFSLVLPDGTQVWLNAASSITYPTAFVGNERKVKITGEVYFEVAHNPSMPFIVSREATTVTVLGTHFNVNAYSDEPDMKVTLLEGSVRIHSEAGSRKSEVIQPGQQVIAKINGELSIVNNVDVEQVMAWKNGVFMMNKADIATIMRQIARWYNVDIVYQNSIPKGTISGEVPRSFTLSQVLKVYEYSGVHFIIEGKKIIVKE